MTKSPDSRRSIKLSLLILYTAWMLILLFKRAHGGASDPYWEQLRQRVNFAPFLTVGNYLHALLHGGLTQKRLAIINLVGNVIMFVPFGYLLPDLFRQFRPFFRHFLNCLALICLVEILQLFTLRGIMDVDDVILNMIGFSVGYLAYRIHASCWNSDKEQSSKGMQNNEP